MRRAFVPAVRQDPLAVSGGWTNGTQRIARTENWSTPSSSCGASAGSLFRNSTSAVLTISLFNDSDKGSMIYALVNSSWVVRAGVPDSGRTQPQTIVGNIAPNSYYCVLSSAGGTPFTINAMASGVLESDFAQTLLSASGGSTSTYLGCVQDGTDNGDGTFTPNGNYFFRYTSSPTYSAGSATWSGGGGSVFNGPNPGVSTSTCAAGVGTYGGGGGA